MTEDIIQPLTDFRQRSRPRKKAYRGPSEIERLCRQLSEDLKNRKDKP